MQADSFCLIRTIAESSGDQQGGQHMREISNAANYGKKVAIFQ